MESAISPQYITTDAILKLFNKTFEPTEDNISYIWNLASSINYGLPELTNEQIDIWISMLSFLRSFFLQNKEDLILYILPSIIEVSYISTQIALICAKRKKKIPDLLKILEGQSDETITVPDQIMDFPIVPTIQNNGIVTDILDSFEMFKPLHQFKMPSFDSIIHYSIIMALIYCEQLQQPTLDSFEAFKKRTKYVFNFPTDFSYDISTLPPVDEPFSFVLIRSIFEDLNNTHLKRPFTNDTAFSDIINTILKSTEKLDQTKFYSAFVYIESKPISFPIELCSTEYSSLIFLLICELDFNSKIEYESGKVFHFTPSFLMTNKFINFFSRNLDFGPLIDMQMKSLFGVAKYVIEKVEPTTIEILTDKNNYFSLTERLHALGSLSVEELKEDVYSHVLSFWCSIASNLISELETAGHITSDHLNGLIGICRVAVTFSKKGEFRSIDSILNHQTEKFEGEIPSSFPTYSYSTPSDALAMCDSFHVNYSSLKIVIRYLILITSLDIKISPNEVLMKLNEDYYKTEEKRQLEDPLLFIALRYVYESTFNTFIERQTKNENIFIEASKNDSIVDALNSLAFTEGSLKVSLTKELFEKRDLYFALITSNAVANNDPMKLCDQLTQNAFKVAAYVISNCQSEVENLVTRASFDDKDAAVQLLQHKECLPLLVDKNSIYHSLLKIFLSDEQPSFKSEISLDDWVEISAKLFVCKQIQKPPPTEFLIQIIKKCYYFLFDDPILTVLDKDVYLYFCGVMDEQNINIFEKQEDFFIDVNNVNEENTLDFTNTILFYTLQFLKDDMINQPEMIHYYCDFAGHSLVSSKVKELLPKPEEYRIIYWFLCTCIFPYNRSSDLSFLIEEMEPKFIKPLYQYLLLFKDVQCLLQMIQNKRCSKLTETVGLEYLNESLDLFFITDSIEAITELASILYDEDKSFLIRFICSHIIEYPKYSMILFKKFKISEKVAIEFISNLQNLEQPIPRTLIPFFESILHPISKKYLLSKQTKLPTLELNWNEDEVIKDDYIDLWKDIEYTQCEGNNNSCPHFAFYCYTCDIQDTYICTACAATCHKGHRISYIKKCRFHCSCKNNYPCTFCTQREEEAQTKSIVKSLHPPTSKLVDLLLAISQMSNESQNQVLIHSKITSKLSTSFYSVSNRSYDLAPVLPRIIFKDKKSDIVNLDGISSHYNHYQNMYKKRCSYIPLHLSEYANNHIIVSVGKKLYSIDDTTYEVDYTLELNEELLSVKLAKTNDKYLVLTSLKSVTIVTSNDFTKVDTIVPTNLNENNSIIQAEMPIDNKVAVVTRLSVQLYELNNKEPIERFNVNNDTITSSVFVNYENKPYGLFALNNGRIAIQLLGEGEKATVFTRYSKLPSRFVSISISYSQKVNMLFIAAPGTSIQYTRLENAFRNEQSQTNQLRSSLVNEIYFYSTYPNVDSILLFVDSCNNSMYSIEFTDDGPEISSIESFNRKSGFSLFDNRFKIFSFISTPSEILGISTKGSLMTLVGCEEEEYRAPPTLFTMTEVANEDKAEITGTDTSQNYNTLFHDSVAFFHVNVDPKIMTLVLKDTSYSIVGFTLTFSEPGASHRPSYISVFDRKYNCIRNYGVTVSLKPGEVRPGKPLEIEFSNSATSDISMQGIKIYIIKSDKIKPFLRETFQYQNDVGVLKDDILDIDDEVNETGKSNIENLMSIITTSIDDENKNEISNEAFEKLIDNIYTNEFSSPYAKSAVIRIIKSTDDENRKKELFDIWCNELNKLIQKKQINDKLWPVTWEDYMLLPEDAKTKIDIKDNLWSNQPKIGSAESILSAFTSKD